MEGFEGPLDLLLELARTQKVDLAKISILRLVEQFLAALGGRAAGAGGGLAGDGGMADLAEIPACCCRMTRPKPRRVRRRRRCWRRGCWSCSASRAAANWLGDRPMLGRDLWGRGESENFTEIDRSGLAVDTAGLLRALHGGRSAAAAAIVATNPPLPPLWSVQDALGRLGALLGRTIEWTQLERFLPEMPMDPLAVRAATAATLLAGLEMARDGRMRLRQDQAFGPILLAGRPDGG